MSQKAGLGRPKRTGWGVPKAQFGVSQNHKARAGAEHPKMINFNQRQQHAAGTFYSPGAARFSAQDAALMKGGQLAGPPRNPPAPLPAPPALAPAAGRNARRPACGERGPPSPLAPGMLGAVVPSPLPPLGRPRPQDYSTQKARGRPRAARPSRRAVPGRDYDPQSAPRRGGAARAGAAGPAGSGAGGARLRGARLPERLAAAAILWCLFPPPSGPRRRDLARGRETERGQPGPSASPSLRLPAPRSRPPRPRPALPPAAAASGAHAPLWKTTGSPGPCEWGRG